MGLDSCHVDTQERRQTSPALGFQSWWAIQEVHGKYFKMLQSILSGHIKCSPLGERSVTDALQVTLLSGFVDSCCCLMWLQATLSLNLCLGLTYSTCLCSGPFSASANGQDHRRLCHEPGASGGARGALPLSPQALADSAVPCLGEPLV